MKTKLITFTEEDKKFLVKVFKIYGWIWFGLGFAAGFILRGAS